ncbi:hypothetical protein HHI36_014270 [Cryptolaemus montrouzieri]|uniref:Uncharacterized protein n=1 Tax=Cryptolaemus montrouzieri TaxID=559131 RepID=A0ABD2N316_9CUCU
MLIFLKIQEKAINNNKYSIFDSDEVKQIRNTLDAIDTIFKVTRSNGAYVAYKKCKEILRQKIEFGKKQHLLGLIQESDNKIKTVWNIMKKEVTKPVMATNANLSADELNDFFANVGGVNSSLGPQTNDKAMQLLEKRLPKIDLTFTLHLTSDFEVSNIIYCMKSKNTQDIYGMSTKFVESIQKVLIHPLAVIFNKCLHEDFFQNILKKQELYLSSRKVTLMIRLNLACVCIASLFEDFRDTYQNQTDFLLRIKQFNE